MINKGASKEIFSMQVFTLKHKFNVSLILLIFGIFTCSVYSIQSLAASTSKTGKESQKGSGADGQHLNPVHEDKVQELLRLRNEGVAHYESGVAQKKAIKVFEQALAMKPDSAIEHYNLAVAYRKQNLLDKSIEHFNQALKLDKEFAHVYYSLGLIYREQGKVEEALDVFKKASEIMPAEPSSHYQLSRLYRELNDEDKTLQAIVNTLQLDPYHTGATYQLYLYHQNNGDKEKSQQLFAEFSRLKKAFGKTRQEINADESILSNPIDSRSESKAVINSAQAFIPQFSPTTILKNHLISDFEVTDFNRDGSDDIIAVSQVGEILFYSNNQKGEFSLVRSYTLEGKPKINDLVVARLRQSGGTEVVVATSAGIYLSSTKIPEGELKKKGKSKKERIPFNESEFDKEIILLSDEVAQALHLIDVDHDGDLEIVVDNFRQIFVNKGNAQFTAKASPLSEQDSSVVNAFNMEFAGSDFRNLTTMVDFVLYDKAGQRRLLRDEMGGRYKLLNKNSLSAIPNINWSANADMNNDGWTEIVSLTPKGLVIDYNSGKHQFSTQMAGSTATEQSLVSAAVLDVNNDGFKDIFVAGTNGLGVWNKGSDDQYVFNDIKGVETAKEPLNKHLGVIDADSDGLLDIVALNDSGQMYLLANKTPNKNANWVKLNLNGLRSSPDAHYVQAEVRYGDFYSKYEANGSNLHIPLGNATHAEILRLTWPNGFVENKFKIDNNQQFSFDESERISGSCPSIYAWDGERYNYVTDAFISGPMGVPMGSGRYFPVDHDEYVKIPASMMQQEGDSFKVSIVEELKEVTYLDQIRIYAIDSPEGTDVYPNEYLNPPSFPEFGLHITQNAQPLLAARDHYGNDVLSLVSELDYQYPHQFVRTQYTGFTTPHSVELELPREAYQSDDLKLFFTGWFYYFDSTSLISASQRQQEMRMQMPELQAWVGGEWKAVKTIGIPSGKDKTIVVEAGGQIPLGTEKLRIVSNVEIYWDRILYDTDKVPDISQSANAMVELPLKHAQMAFHGFSRLLRPVSEFPQPDRFDYHDVSYRSMWDPLEGRYTRYGKVNALLGNEDSKMAVLGSGDEVSLEFDGSRLPKLRKGWKRDFILYLNGYVKDGDKYTVHAGHVEPMPFSGMESYPFSAKDEVDNPRKTKEYQEYLNEYQTREPVTFTRVAVDRDSSKL